jgi:nucleoside-diphosphate-sugar epimerase
MKIFVIGASGYIGKNLFDVSSSTFNTIGTSSSGSSGLLKFVLNQPQDFDYNLIDVGDVVLLAAAISAPDRCASDPEYARAVNVTGTVEFIENACAKGANVIFFSTDAVYGEQAFPITEATPANPSGDYAVMKHQVESYFLGYNQFKSIRLSYVFSKHDKFTSYLVNCARSNEEAELFHPFCRAFIHRDDVIEGVLSLAMRWYDFPFNVINFGGQTVVSRIDYAEIVQSCHFPNLSFRVVQPSDEFFKNRPRIIAMDSDVLVQLLGRRQRSVNNALQMEFGH